MFLPQDLLCVHYVKCCVWVTCYVNFVISSFSFFFSVDVTIIPVMISKKLMMVIFQIVFSTYNRVSV